MIDTYFDRADRATGYHLMKRTPMQNITEDPRYWGGQLYATVTARMVAEARAMVRFTVAAAARDHQREMYCGIPLGSKHSVFDGAGRRKTKVQA
ncbi:MAG: hypothetical protein RL758_85 [Pseudomonadota bacterium]|jgi:hypothetical protein